MRTVMFEFNGYELEDLLAALNCYITAARAVTHRERINELVILRDRIELPLRGEK